MVTNTAGWSSMIIRKHIISVDSILWSVETQHMCTGRSQGVANEMCHLV